jgi:hypothetical protein
LDVEIFYACWDEEFSKCWVGDIGVLVGALVGALVGTLVGVMNRQ